MMVGIALMADCLDKVVVERRKEAVQAAPIDTNLSKAQSKGSE
jgi:hypothetical protein